MGDSKYGTSGGKELTEALIESLAEEAEKGYDIKRLRPRSRRGRPPIGEEAAAPFQVRLEPELRDALGRAAKGERTSPSEVTRRALRSYLTEGGASRTVATSASPRGALTSAASKAGLADQQMLLRWADSVGARSEFPRLVRRLILETGRGVVQLGFPAAEGIAAGDWDGTVRATEPTAFVPKGLSVWELSVDKSVGRKANGDYSKRVTALHGSPTESTTYVAASLRRWRDRSRWARDRSNEGWWEEVRAYGVDDIETWLETAPVTHAWISEELGLWPYGLRAAESWWWSWASETTPEMSPQVVLAGRQAAVEELWKRLAGSPQLTTLRAGSLGEALAFLAAVGTQAAYDGDPRLLARTAFVDDVRTWRTLISTPGELLLVAASADVIREAASGSDHHVVVPTTARVGGDIELPPIDAVDAAGALTAAGIDNDRKAQELGYLARRSLIALRRRLANKPELHVPYWARAAVTRMIRAVVLAGRWHEARDGDREAVAALAGLEYEEMRESLVSLADNEDPLLAVVDRSWALVSPFDAWLMLGSNLNGADLKRFESAVKAVLWESDPALELPPEDRWKAALESKARAYSDDLRNGLVGTLALLGVHGQRVDLGGGSTGDLWAASLVRDLLRTANEDDTMRLWASIADLLPTLVEAAPDAFLDEVREGVADASPTLRGIFTDRDGDGLFGNSSPHTGLLWALESVAWSGEYFGQAVDLLARLAEIDPGGRLSNRPSNSLAEIYCPWHPETSADVSRRLSVLDALRRRHEGVAWELMLSTLPESHGIHIPTHEPQFRDWKPALPAVTTVEYLQFVTQVVERLLESATTAESWTSLLNKYPQLPPADRERVLQTLTQRLEGRMLADSEAAELWTSLRSLIAQHRQYAGADWALAEEELQLLDTIEARIRPSDPVRNSGWLFSEHMPDLGDAHEDGDFKEYDQQLAKRRRQAIEDVLLARSFEGVRALANSSPVPWSVGVALADAAEDAHEHELLELIEAEDSRDVEMALAYAGRRFERDGWPWINGLIGENSALSSHQKGRVLLATRDYPRAWEVAHDLGHPVMTEFWKHFLPYGLGADFPHTNVAATRLLEVGRHTAALELLQLYCRSDKAGVNGNLIADALELLLASGSSDPDPRLLSEHDFQTLFSALDVNSKAVGWERIARLQWAFLPVLGLRPKVKELHRLLSEDPGFFVQVLSMVYRPKGGGEADEVTPERQRVAVNGYRLLSSWSALPGKAVAGGVPGEALRAWIREARVRLKEADRLEVGDVHIGHALASAPAEADGGWPSVEVRELLEELQNEHIEEGLLVETLNKRGVTIRSPQAGGTQEQDLAAKYRREADGLADQWPRTAAILRSIARSYEHDARREENSAERFRRGLSQ